MRTRRIEVIKPTIKSANSNNFGCSRKFGGPVITETDLELAKISLRSANIQKKFFQKLFLLSINNH